MTENKAPATFQKSFWRTAFILFIGANGTKLSACPKNFSSFFDFLFIFILPRRFLLLFSSAAPPFSYDGIILIIL